VAVTSPVSFSQSSSVTYVDYTTVQLRVCVSLLSRQGRTNYRSHLKVLYARRGPWSKFHTEEQQTSSSTVQNLVIKTTDAPDLRTIAHTHRRYAGQNILLQGCRNYSTRVQNRTRHSLLSHFFSFFRLSDPRPTSVHCAEHVCVCARVCVCACTHTHTHTHTHTSGCVRLCMNYRWYETTLQWNILTQIGAVRSSHWVFIVGVPVWRRLGECLILDKVLVLLSNR